jgi:acetyl esterase/lipase
VGTNDSVLDDSLFMAARWEAAGNRAELQVYPEGTHLFMAYPTQMAAESRRRKAAFLASCLA